MKISLELPNMQIGFASALQEIRSLYLQDVLTKTVSSLSISEIDSELHRYADEDSLSCLASHGMRGELLFAVPCILKKNPRLLGYYRLLLGYSQKGFYTTASGVGRFKSLEEKGTLLPRQNVCLPALCEALNTGAKYMLDHLQEQMISAAFFDQLTLLTLGLQLRGGANVQRGSSAISQLFDIVFELVKGSIVSSDRKCIELKNSSGRTVYIQFSADPDIFVREELADGKYRNLVAVEVKGGQDYSNIHNRIGEAEKSHQKAKKDGYIECWTVVNVDRFDIKMAQKESPTTNQFYLISDLLDKSSDEYKDFSQQLLSIVRI